MVYSDADPTEPKSREAGLDPEIWSRPWVLEERTRGSWGLVVDEGTGSSVRPEFKSLLCSLRHTPMLSGSPSVKWVSNVTKSHSHHET